MLSVSNKSVSAQLNVPADLIDGGLLKSSHYGDPKSSRTAVANTFLFRVSPTNEQENPRQANSSPKSVQMPNIHEDSFFKSNHLDSGAGNSVTLEIVWFVLRVMVLFFF